jgi:hypothetical protein
MLPYGVTLWTSRNCLPSNEQPISDPNGTSPTQARLKNGKHETALPSLAAPALRLEQAAVF